MKKIAILTCLKANDVCTGAGCLEALLKKEGYFAQYVNDDIQLVAFWTCNGCEDVLLNNQNGLIEKLEKIISLKTDIVHVGKCTIKEKEKIICPEIEKIISFLKINNIKVVLGTHN